MTLIIHPGSMLEMKALVTGGAGFIGSHIQDALIELGHEVAILDNFRSGKKENLNSKATLFEIDIQNKEAVSEAVSQFKPEVIFHLAAQNEVPYSMEHPFEDAQTNILGTMNILEASKANGVKKIIYSNTGGAFYGEVPEDKLPIDEELPAHKPTSFYGVSKHCAEIYLRLYGNLYNLQWVSLRYANVYGPRQEGNKEAGVVAIFTEKLLKKEQPIINGDGQHIRDYIFVEDVVKANIKALNYNQSDYFNISTGTQTTTQQVFDAIESNLKTGIKPLNGPDRPGDPRKISLSSKKAQEKLGWEATVDFTQGIEKTIQFYLNK